MKKRINISFFIISLTVLNIWDILFFAYNLIGGDTWSILCLTSLFCCLYFASKLINDFEFENAYFRFVFTLLIVYNFITIARGSTFTYTEIKANLQTSYVFWPFVIPMFVFFEKNLDTLVKLLRAMYSLGVVFLIISISYPDLLMRRSTAETFIHPFAFGAGFLLLNAKYLSRKKTLVCMLVCIVAVLSFTYLARRNAILTFSGFMVAALFLYYKDMSLGKFSNLVIIVCGLIVLTVSFSDKIPSSFTSRISERALEDSRSVVFDAFFKDPHQNWVFGKGMNGTYYCPFNEGVLDDGTIVNAVDNRNVIENGYLQLILSGGYIEMILFILVSLPAVYLGIFKSSNNFSKACGILIALWLLDMAVYGLPRLYLQYIFVWICVGICYKKSLREISEEEIYEAFKNNRLT